MKSSGQAISISVTNLEKLPTEVIIDIFCRLPIRTIVSCKCVCKSWFQLAESSEFVDFHLSKSIPGLIIYRKEWDLASFHIFELKDELDLKQHEHHYVPITKFGRRAIISSYHADISMEGSTNGLLFFLNKHPMHHSPYICNPVTRKYINLPNSERTFDYPSVVTYGFGISKTTNQYKVVRISHECEIDNATGSISEISKLDCGVYTLGMGVWRSVPHYSLLVYNCRSNDTYLNGNLHWLASDLKKSLFISCFDLEKERFEVFSPPHSLLRNRLFTGDVGVLGDRLCLCDNTSNKEVVIWVMKVYGEANSWTKYFIINKFSSGVGDRTRVDLLKVFRDGDILMLWGYWHSQLLHYSNKSKTISSLEMSELKRPCQIQARQHISSFLSLKRFAMENVLRF